MYNITQLWYNYIVNVFGGIEVFMKENVNKQLSLSQRTRIEEMLNQRKRKYEIARIMGGDNVSELMLENARQLLETYSGQQSDVD